MFILFCYDYAILRKTRSIGKPLTAVAMKLHTYQPLLLAPVQAVRQTVLEV